MKAPLIFCSSSYSINVKKIFKVVLARAFDLKCTVPEIHNVGEPIIEYSNVDQKDGDDAKKDGDEAPAKKEEKKQ